MHVTLRVRSDPRFRRLRRLRQMFSVAIMFLLHHDVINTRRLPVLRMKYSGSVEVMLSKDDRDFQRHFRVSRAVFDHVCGVIKTQVESLFVYV